MSDEVDTLKTNSAPALNWLAALQIVEAKVRPSQHLGQHNDLTGVHREVFGYVEDGVEESDVVALDLATLQKKRGVKGA